MESIGRDLREMQRVPLSVTHVAALQAVGTVRRYPAGAFVARAGEPANRFVYVQEGEIEVVNPFTDGRHIASTLGPTQFMAEISFLNGGSWLMPMRAVTDTTVIEVPRIDMLRLMSEIPEMSDIVITVLAARRRQQVDRRYGTLVLIGEDEDRAVRRIADFASRNRLPYMSYALGSPEAAAVATSCSVSPDEPAVIFGRDVVVAVIDQQADLLHRRRYLAPEQARCLGRQEARAPGEEVEADESGATPDRGGDALRRLQPADLRGDGHFTRSRGRIADRRRGRRRAAARSAASRWRR